MHDSPVGGMMRCISSAEQCTSTPPTALPSMPSMIQKKGDTRYIHAFQNDGSRSGGCTTPQKMTTNEKKVEKRIEAIIALGLMAAIACAKVQ